MSTPPVPSGMILASGLRAVDEALKALPPDKTTALIVTTKLEGGEIVTRTGFALRLGKDWAFAAEAETDWKTKHGGQVAVRWSK